MLDDNKYTSARTGCEGSFFSVAGYGDLAIYSSEKLWEILRSNTREQNGSDSTLFQLAKSELQSRKQWDNTNPWKAPH